MNRERSFAIYVVMTVTCGTLGCVLVRVLWRLLEPMDLRANMTVSGVSAAQ